MALHYFSKYVFKVPLRIEIKTCINAATKTDYDYDLTGALWSHYHAFYSAVVERRKPSASLYCSSSIACHVDCLDEIFEARAWVWRTVSY